MPYGSMYPPPWEEEWLRRFTDPKFRNLGASPTKAPWPENLARGPVDMETYRARTAHPAPRTLGAEKFNQLPAFLREKILGNEDANKVKGFANRLNPSEPVPDIGKLLPKSPPMSSKETVSWDEAKKDFPRSGNVRHYQMPVLNPSGQNWRTQPSSLPANIEGSSGSNKLSGSSGSDAMEQDRQRQMWLEMMRNRAGGPSKPPSPKTLNLSSQDVNDLARIAQAEARVLTQRGTEPKKAYGSVADVVMNRMASSKEPATVRQIVEQPKQFQPVAKHGGFDKMPPPSPDAVNAMNSYLMDRMRGGEAIVGKSDHFYNPEISKPAWGSKLSNAQTIGEGSAKHRFGQLGNVPDYNVQVAGAQQPMKRPTPPLGPRVSNNAFVVPGMDIVNASKADAPYGKSATRSASEFRGIVTHHTGDAPTMKYVEYGQKTDPKRGGSFGYHFYVDPSGQVVQGAPMDARTNHIKSASAAQRYPGTASELSNANAVGISQTGPVGKPTPEQMQASERLGKALMAHYGIDPGNIYGHGELQSDRMSIEGTQLAEKLRGGGQMPPPQQVAEATKRDILSYAGHQPKAQPPQPAPEPPVQQAKASPPPPLPTSLAQQASQPPAPAQSPFGQMGQVLQARFSQSPMGQAFAPQSPPTPAAAVNTGMSAVGGAAAPAAPGIGAMAGLMGALGGLAGDAQAQQQIVQQMQQRAAEDERKRLAYAMNNWGWMS